MRPSIVAALLLAVPVSLIAYGCAVIGVFHLARGIFELISEPSIATSFALVVGFFTFMASVIAGAFWLVGGGPPKLIAQISAPTGGCQ